MHLKLQGKSLLWPLIRKQIKLQALSQREQVQVNGHMNTQSQDLSSFLFSVYLTITVSSNTKTETENDKCLHDRHLNTRQPCFFVKIEILGGTKMKSDLS